MTDGSPRKPAEKGGRERPVSVPRQVPLHERQTLDPTLHFSFPEKRGSGPPKPPSDVHLNQRKGPDSLVLWVISEETYPPGPRVPTSPTSETSPSTPILTHTSFQS